MDKVEKITGKLMPLDSKNVALANKAGAVAYQNEYQRFYGRTSAHGDGIAPETLMQHAKSASDLIFSKKDGLVSRLETSTDPAKIWEELEAISPIIYAQGSVSKKLGGAFIAAFTNELAKLEPDEFGPLVEPRIKFAAGMGGR